MLSGQLGFKETRNLKIHLSRNETFATFRSISYSSASGPCQVQCIHGSRETLDNNLYILVQHLALNLEIIRIQLPKLRTMELLKFHLRF